MVDDDAPAAARTRRAPPPFRTLEVRRVVELTPWMRRLVLGGAELEGFPDPGPASSVRLLLPPPGSDTIVLPTWAGNEFVLPDGTRAPIRTFTPRLHDPARHELTIDVVLHDSGAASDWARNAGVGTFTAVSGPGRGCEVDPDAGGHLLAGDETALPAIAQLVEVIDHDTAIDAYVEIRHPDARQDLPAHPGLRATWHLGRPDAPPGTAVVDAIEALDEIPDAVWVAGEAAAVQRVRTHLADVRGRPRTTVTVRGYWKAGRTGT